MSQSKAREARQTIPAGVRMVKALGKQGRTERQLVETKERHAALEIEKADIKAEIRENRRERIGILRRGSVAAK